MYAAEFLDSKNINYRITHHKPAFSAQELAQEEHISGHTVAKPVIVHAGSSYYMCVLPADRKINLESLCRLLGADNATLACENEIRKLCPDDEIGAESPMGTLYNMATLLDESLNDVTEITFQDGHHNEAIHMSMSDFKNVTHPILMRFSYMPAGKENQNYEPWWYYQDPYIEEPEFFW